MRVCGEEQSVSLAPQTLPGNCRWPMEEGRDQYSH